MHKYKKNKTISLFISSKLKSEQFHTWLKGQVIIFLDANVEVNDGWFEPLLSRIASDRSVISVPRIDLISNHDLSYVESNQTLVYGLEWDLFHYEYGIPNTFKQHYPHSFSLASLPDRYPLPEREITRNHGDATAPYRSPAILGTVIAIDREFFFEIGGFDKGLELWGGDNSELSLRVRFLIAFPCNLSLFC